MIDIEQDQGVEGGSRDLFLLYGHVPLSLYLPWHSGQSELESTGIGDTRPGIS